MKSKIILFALFLLFNREVSTQNDDAQIDEYFVEIVNKSELTLHADRVFELVNPHRANSVLKFTLFGPNITGTPVHRLGGSIWRLELSDKSEIFIDRGSTGKNDSTEYRFVWSGEGSSLERELCFHYGYNNASWYSTYEEKTQKWPMDTSKNIPKGTSFTTGDFFSMDIGSIVENLFLNSDGFAVLLYDLDAWFLRRDPNNGDPLLCVSMDQKHFPYRHDNFLNKTVDYFNMELRFMAASNVKVAHQRATVSHDWLRRPKAIPDSQMFVNPIWSTWAQYKKDINQAKVLEFAQEVKKHGFPVSQIEIDDLWEKHYGDFTFDSAKFPDPKKLVDEIHKLGYRVTLWVYPFVNLDSYAYKENGHFLVKNKTGQPATVQWWDGFGGIIDFSDRSASDWFVNRLRHLQRETGIDSFKFAAGELSWYGKDFVFNDTLVQQNPNLITLRYVHACAQLGDMIEVRSGFQTQDLPIFVRMLDKNSNWSIDNGLKSLITTALTMAIGGYSYILPDMIGGNAYDHKPSEELYIRWVQANAFLPSMQFSIPPWVYTNESTVNITRKFVQLHVEHSQTMIVLAKRVVDFGEPIIRPIWYAAPDDPRAFTIADQYMLGEDILVAPVVEEKQTERSVFLPPGTWLDQHGKSFEGSSVMKVAAPLEELPYFKRKH